TIITKYKYMENNVEVQFSANKHVWEIENYEVKQSVHCFADELFEVGTVIVTTPPKEACKIIKGAVRTSLYRCSNQSVPVTVAALDIGLRQLPNPTHQFVLGLDQPIFFTNQSRAAKLSEDGSIAVSLIKYHNPMLEMNHIHEDKEQLESTMELLHPNWKREVV
ncbi:dehydrogenase, partial [Bacillus nitratireducens]|nr:dehydrogenase [Bacillus nitratireducens]